MSILIYQRFLQTTYEDLEDVKDVFQPHSLLVSVSLNTMQSLVCLP